MTDTDTNRRHRLVLHLTAEQLAAVERHAIHLDTDGATAAADLIDKGIEAAGADRG